jgi:hypothetical protein
MPLRSFFEGLGDFLPTVGNAVNYLFMAVGAGLGIYWMMEMRKHQKADEK